jgi:hypothetical protein
MKLTLDRRVGAQGAVATVTDMAPDGRIRPAGGLLTV